MNKKLLGALIVPMLLTSCNPANGMNYEPLGVKVLSPIGAPSVSLAAYAGDTEHVTIAADPSKVVPGAFLKGAGDYDFIIFDGSKGKTFIEKKGAKYKYVRTVTTGNAYVIDLGNDENGKIEEGDKITTFGDPSIFNAIFKEMYGVTTYNNVASTGVAAKVLETGLLEGVAQDYVIVSEPFVTRNLAKNPKAKIKCNLADEFAKYSKEKGYNDGKGYASFPQAALFISDKLENTTDEALIKERDNFLKSFDNFTKDLQHNDGKEMLKIIAENEEKAVYEAKSTFGVDKATLDKVLVGNKLAFNTEDFNINGFFNDVNLAGFTPFASTTFSKLYR